MKPCVSEVLADFFADGVRLGCEELEEPPGHGEGHEGYGGEEEEGAVGC